jgi:hypothetical protein
VVGNLFRFSPEGITIVTAEVKGEKEEAEEEKLETAETE